MNSLKLSLYSLFFLANGLFAQSITLRKVTTLPSIVQETSGIETTNPFYIWTHNDSGGEPALYKVDTFGNLLKTIFLKNTINEDWEGITSDGKNFYIGDIGNNENTRKNLKIYKIQNPDSMDTELFLPQVISFTYPNQYKFPPGNGHLNFDAEALVYSNNHLYIFTKNRTVPFTGYTYLYKIPSTAGQYTAELLDSFKTGIGFKEQWWISAADISPDGKKLVLLSSDKIFVFSDFTDDKFFNGKVKTIELGSFTQKEAIVFYTNTELYITDEYFDILGGKNLYKLSLNTLATEGLREIEKSENVLINFKNQFGQQVISMIDETKKVTVSLIDLNGKVVAKYLLDYTQPIVIIDVAAGYYNLSITDGTMRQDLKIVVD